MHISNTNKIAGKHKLAGFNTSPISLQKFRLSLIWSCNFKCLYCRPGGEGGTIQNKKISKDRALFIAQVFEKIGCEKLNITGGEPFLHPQIIEIANELIQNTSLDITLNTNGSAKIVQLDKLTNNKRMNFVISLDSLDNNTLRKMGRYASSEKIMAFANRVNSLGFKIRINAVICRGLNDQISQISTLLDWCTSKGFELKLQSVFDTSDDTFYQTDKLYTNIEFIREYLFSAGFIKSGFKNEKSGVTEEQYKTKNGGLVRLLDKNISATNYGTICSTCNHFPCDTGLYAFYVNENEQLMICRSRREPLFEFSKSHNLQDTSMQLKEVLQKYHLYI